MVAPPGDVAGYPIGVVISSQTVDMASRRLYQLR